MRIKSFFAFSVFVLFFAVQASAVLGIRSKQPFSLADYDKAVASASQGKFTIVDAISKKMDIGTTDKELKKVLKATFAHFKKESFSAFLEKNDNSLDISGMNLKSQGLLGEGNFGKVFSLSIDPLKTTKKSAATQTYKIAVKMLKEIPENLQDKYELELELNNMKFLSTLKLGNGDAFIPSYYATFADKNGEIYILSMLLSHTLEDYIQTTNEEGVLVPNKRTLTEADLDSFIRTASFALKKLAELNFVHSDFKPDNFMRDENGNFYLIDLGTTRRLTASEMSDNKLSINKIKGSEDSEPMYRIGTPIMKAPERVVSDNSSLSPIDWRKSDNYALGLSILALLKQQTVLNMFEHCDSTKVCPKTFLRAAMTLNDFNLFRDYVKSIIPENAGDSKIVKGAKRLVLRLLNWLPSDRPLDVGEAYAQEYSR